MLVSNEDWLDIKERYRLFYSIPPRVLDYVACDSILQMCCAGLSNKTIATWVGYEEEYVYETLKEFLNFTGHKQDLEIDPLVVYNECNGDYFVFITRLEQEGLEKARIYFNICRRYDKIGKEIKKYYDES
jgi:hypothetical protein